jgi:predicted GH43/DUF377 family glycosyl hydrolase
MNMSRRSVIAAGAALGMGAIARPLHAAENAVDLTGIVLTKGPAGSWDDLRVAIGVPRFDEAKNRYLMWYYGRDANYRKDAPPTLASGRIGVAESKDGVKWTRIRGPGPLGSVLDHGAKETDYDYLHIGLTDVTRHKGEWWMWTFGGGMDVIQAPTGPTAAGYRMRAGLATSKDGIVWTKRPANTSTGGLLDYEPDDAFAAWPNGLHEGDAMLLYYTAVKLNARGPFRSLRAISTDGGKNWKKEGALTFQGETPLWEEMGIMTRQVIANPLGQGGKWLMIYTALEKDTMKRSIALATSQDGMAWKRLRDKPIFEVGPANAWDGGGVAAPQLLVKGKDLYLYYHAFPVKEKEEEWPKGMGLAIARGGDLSRFERVPAQL